MARVLRPGLLATVLALLTLSALAATPEALTAGVFEPPAMAPEFKLRASDGRALSLARWHGKLVLLVFGFTHCTDVCPVTLATLAQARAALGAQASAVQVVYVTVDPARDDASTIQKYLGQFDPSFVGGTGSPDALAAMRQRYGVVAARLPSQDGRAYGMSHSTSVYLIDGAGRLRAMMPFGHPAQDYLHDLRLLLAGR